MKQHFELRNSIHDPILHGTFYQPTTSFGTILFIHDVNESRFRYEQVAQFFNNQHMTFVTYDLRGHHKSLIQNKRGHFGDDEGAQLLLSDVIEVTHLIKERSPHQKLILMGKGIGAYLALLAFDYEPSLFNQLVLINPNSLPKFVRAKYTLLNLLTYRQPSLVKPQYNKWMGVTIESKNTQSRYSFLSHNKKIINEYIHDPFCGYQLTSRAIRDVLEIMLAATKSQIEPSDQERPVTIIGGKDDPLTHYGRDLVELKRRFIQSGYGLTTLSIFENLKHDVLLEIDSNYHLDQLLQTICAWQI